MSNEELLAEVRRTNQLLEQLLRRIDGLGRVAGGAGAPAGGAMSAGGGAPAAGVEIADDNDLDSQWGNPTVRKDPPRWTGQTYAGATYSDCPPDYLETLAGFLSWQAAKSDEKNEMANNGKPRSGYLRKDAARARGWARRNASKGQRPAARPAARPAPMDEAPMMDDDVPFLSALHEGGAGNEMGRGGRESRERDGAGLEGRLVGAWASLRWSVVARTLAPGSARLAGAAHGLQNRRGARGVSWAGSIPVRFRS